MSPATGAIADKEIMLDMAFTFVSARCGGGAVAFERAIGQEKRSRRVKGSVSGVATEDSIKVEDPFAG